VYLIPIFYRQSSQLLERLNIYYLILEKTNSFTEETKYDVANIPGAQIAQIYEEKRTDAWSVIENLNITKRIISVCALPNHSYFLKRRRSLILIEYICAAKIVQANRSQNNLGRAGTTTPSIGSASRFPASRTPSSSSSAPFKKTPPPPPGASSHADPPPSYTPSPHGNGAAALAAAKRAPPPPPALKPKPKPSVQHVVALYDFAAQVRFSFIVDLMKFYI
jgi:amphiphysin